MLLRSTRRNNNGRSFFFLQNVHLFASLFLKRVAVSNECKAHALLWNLALHSAAFLPFSLSLCSSSWLVHATPAFVHFCKKSRIRTVYMLLRRYRRYLFANPSQSFENTPWKLGLVRWWILIRSFERGRGSFA